MTEAPKPEPPAFVVGLPGCESAYERGRQAALADEPGGGWPEHYEGSVLKGLWWLGWIAGVKEFDARKEPAR